MMIKVADRQDKANPGIRQFRRVLRSLEREVELSLASQSRCCGITNAQCHLLLEIEARGKACVGELAGALDLDPSTLSRTADTLVKTGLVSRVEDPANRRRQILELLPAGRKKVGYINSICDAYYEDVLAGQDAASRQTLTDSIAVLARAIRAKRRGENSRCSLSAKIQE